jgi:hypothetical protein
MDMEDVSDERVMKTMTEEEEEKKKSMKVLTSLARGRIF